MPAMVVFYQRSSAFIGGPILKAFFRGLPLDMSDVKEEFALSILTQFLSAKRSADFRDDPTPRTYWIPRPQPPASRHSIRFPSGSQFDRNRHRLVPRSGLAMGRQGRT
jgi:hypothetical protein